MAQPKTPASHHTTAQILMESADEQRRQGYLNQAADTVQHAQVHALLAISGQMLDSAALSLSKHLALYDAPSDEDAKDVAFDEVMRSAAARLGISPHGIA
jgi:hypothetical protein